MNAINPAELDLGFVHPGTPMFSDVIRHLEQKQELAPTRRRDMISGLRRVANALDRAPENTPASPKWLQPRLQKIEPAARNLTAKSWSNAVSSVRAALADFGALGDGGDRRINRRTDLSPEWAQLWDLALTTGDHTIQASLGRFVYFLNRLGVAPNQVGDSYVVAFREALTANEIRRSPELAYRDAITGRNLAVRKLPSWPQVNLTVPNRQRRVKLEAHELSQGLREDLDRLTAQLSHPDILDEHARLKRLRPSTIAQYRNQLLRFAGEVVRSGVAAEAIDGIAVLCSPEMVERGLRQMLARNEGQTTRSLGETAKLLGNLAKSFCRLPEDEVKAVARLAARVATKPKTGMTAKNRSRLRALQDPDRLTRLLLLPEHLFERHKHSRKPLERARDREVAIAIAILQVCPIRVTNLATIHLDRNLQRPGDGKVFLVFDSTEVKNERPLEFELPADLVRMIDRHCATRSPRLCPNGCAWLFPKRDGSGAIRGGDLSSRLAKCIRRETGLEINAHLFRHLAAMIWLDANPGSYETVRRLLGHSDLSHTLNLYTGLEGRAATRAFADLVATRRPA